MQKLDIDLVHHIIERYQDRFNFPLFNYLRPLEEGEKNFAQDLQRAMSKDIELFDKLIEVLAHPFFLEERLQEKSFLKSPLESFCPLLIKKVLKALYYLKEAEKNLSSYLSLRPYLDFVQRRSFIALFLTKRLYSCRPVDGFLFSLFKDIGHIEMLSRDPKYRKFFLENYFSLCQGDFSEKESALFSLNHLLLGYHLAQIWLLPAHVTRAILTCETVECSHGDKTTVSYQKNSMKSTMYCAHHLALCSEYNLDIFWKKIFNNSIILKNLDLSKEDFIALIEDLWERKEQYSFKIF